ncbi:helix-turn-helix transcriptional regulator [Ligilactobacillus ruminis]|uniref:Helix-turn-helix transcriptional regulator n=1 Tax=Ligilactobacillus ruminis TaxID=1623 RepID=A0AAQ2XMI4_9LACO|nr:helix-turn-helix transcriptional regulator [Ligilactobacillus ruminis]WDC82498.1 helix-turn-helix transcriptional regulator [Ligilactobacillus ruminis]
MNRIKELRIEQKKTQKDAADFLGMSEQVLSYYERGKREPKLKTWEKLAEYFGVPVPYLMGISNDRDGWDEWSKNTGYSIDEIKNEINRLLESGRISKNEDIQKQIGYAVRSLEGDIPTATNAVLRITTTKLRDVRNFVQDSFLISDEKVVCKLGKLQ